MDTKEVRKYAMDFAIAYEKEKNRECINVESGRLSKDFKGFDLISFSNDKKEIRTIEVKGTTKTDINDLHETELTRNKKLVATHLYVVDIDEDKRKVRGFYVIPSIAFNKEDFYSKIVYKVKSNFKTTKMLKYKENLTEDEISRLG